MDAAVVFKRRRVTAFRVVDGFVPLPPLVVEARFYIGSDVASKLRHASARWCARPAWHMIFLVAILCVLVLLKCKHHEVQAP